MLQPEQANICAYVYTRFISVRRTLVQSMVLRLHIVCLSVHPSVTAFLYSHRKRLHPNCRNGCGRAFGQYNTFLLDGHEFNSRRVASLFLKIFIYTFLGP